MDKKALKSTLSRLEQLDLKGVGPDMLQAIANRDVQTVMQQPIILQRTGERLERIRRLKDELKAPGSHLKPEKPKKAPAQAAAEEDMGPPGHLPAGPGSPLPPSNLLGGFDPAQIEQSQSAMMGRMPKMSAAQVAAGEITGRPLGDGGADVGQAEKSGSSLRKRGPAHTEGRCEEGPEDMNFVGATKEHPVLNPSKPSKTINPMQGKEVEPTLGDYERTKKAYKYGFFTKLAETGLRPSMLEKRAVVGPLLAWLGLSGAKKGKEEATGVASVLKDLVSSGLIWPMVAAPVLGAGVGGAYRYATAPGYASPDDFHHVERLAELKKHTRAARRRARNQKG